MRPESTDTCTVRGKQHQPVEESDEPSTILLASRRPTDHELTVVLPAYNEQSRLPRTLVALEGYLNALEVDYRVLVADDGSQDRTAQLTDEFGPRFSTMHLPHCGKGHAVRAAMLAATGQVLAFTDADLPYDLAALRQGFGWIRRRECEVVFGTRHARGSGGLARRRWLRRLASRAFRAFVKRLILDDLADSQCGLKLFSRRAAVEIFSRAEIDGFAFDVEVILLAKRLGLQCSPMPVTLVNETASTVSLARDVLPMLLDVVRVSVRLGRDPLVPRLERGWGQLPAKQTRATA